MIQVLRRRVDRLHHHLKRLLIISHMAPRLLPPPNPRHRPRRKRQVDQIKRPKRDNQSHRIRHIIKPLHAHGRSDAHLGQEAIKVGRDGDSVDAERAEVEAVEEVVVRVGVLGVQGGDVEEAAAQQVVVADEDAGDGAEEDLVGAEEVDEDGGGGEEVPGADCVGEDCRWLVFGRDCGGLVGGRGAYRRR